MSRAETKQIIDGKFIAASAYLVAMTVLDIETTFAAIHNGAHEANPVIKPFIKNGRPATYAFEIGIDALTLWTAYKMRASENKTLNKTWWILPTIMATGHGVAGGLNLRYIW
jgi:hypothetical protein